MKLYYKKNVIEVYQPYSYIDTMILEKDKIFIIEIV